MTKHLLPLLFLSALACSGDDDSGSTDGTDGTSADGADGGDGTDGADGADGTDGTDGTDGADGTDGTSTDDVAYIRVSHLIPDVPGVDIHVNGGDAVITNLEWPNINDANYLEVPAGTYDFQVSLAGQGADNAAIEIVGLPLDAGTYYTAMASGSLGAGDLSALALVDDYKDLPTDAFRVQIVHNAAAVGEVDIWNITDPSNPQPLVTDVPFRASTVAELPAGQYNVCFDVDNNATCDVSFTLPDLPGGLFLNLVAINDADGNVWLQAQLEDGTTQLIAAD